MAAKWPVIIYVVDRERGRDKRSEGVGVKAIQIGKKGDWQIFYKQVEGGISKLRYSFRVVHRPRWVKQLNSRL